MSVGPFSDRSSAVLPIAVAHTELTCLVDELIVRVFALYDVLTNGTGTRSTLPQDSDQLWTAVEMEVRAWWRDHGLDELRDSGVRAMQNDIICREPCDAALVVIGMFADERLPRLAHEQIRIMLNWYESLQGPRRQLGHALARRILAPWYSREASRDVERELCNLVGEGASLGFVRAGILVGLGLLSMDPEGYAGLAVKVLRALERRDDLALVSQDSALGLLVRQLWLVQPNEVITWLHTHPGVSRKVLRLAMERIPSWQRKPIIAEWKRSHPRMRELGWSG